IRARRNVVATIGVESTPRIYRSTLLDGANGEVGKHWGAAMVRKRRGASALSLLCSASLRFRSAGCGKLDDWTVYPSRSFARRTDGVQPLVGPLSFSR